MEALAVVLCVLGLVFTALIFISPFLLSGRISEWERTHEQPTKD